MKINVRHAEACDLKDIKAILADTSVMLGTMRLPFVSDAAIEKRLAPAEDAWKLAAEVEGRVAGICFMSTFPGVPRHNHVGEIDLLAVHGDYQGKGLAKALLIAALDLADNWLQLDRTGLLVWSDNDRAMRLYQAFGFEIEGTIRRYARRPGGFADAVMLGRLADEADSGRDVVNHALASA